MLDYIRDRKRSALSWFFMIALSAVFVLFFGPQATGDCQGSGPATYAARVDGVTIPENEYNFMYSNRLRDMAQQQPDFNLEKAKEMDLRKEVLDDVIEQYLLSNAAAARGLRVSDDELVEAIAEAPYFQRDGKFDPDAYEKLVNFYFRTSMHSFEEFQRRRMLAGKMVQALQHGVQVSEEEVKAEFINRNDKIKLEFVRVDPIRFKDGVELTDADIATFVKDNEEKLKEEYDKKKYKYRKPEKRKARHILIKLDKDANIDREKDARKKIEDIFDKVKAGEDFAETAKKFSEGPTASKGGDLGFFGKGTMDKAFEEATWKLKVGEISEPVRSAFGFHVIKLDEIQAAEIQELEDVKSELAKDLAKTDKAKTLAKAEAERLLAGVKGGKSLADIAPKDPAIPGDKKYEDLTGDEKTAYDAEKKAANPYALRVDETSEFARSSANYVPKIGIDKDLHTAVFSLTQDKAVPEKIFEVNDRFYVLRLTQRSPAVLDNMEDSREGISDQLRASKAATAVDQWVTTSREGADIIVNKSVLEYGQDQRTGG